MTTALDANSAKSAEVCAAPIKWRTPSMSDDRIAEIAATLERIAGNVSCYAGGGSYAHRLRAIADEIAAPGIAPWRP